MKEVTPFRAAGSARAICGWPVALIAALGCAALPAPREQLHQPGALLFNGYANPVANCYRCHGPDGRGSARGPDLVLASHQLTDPVMETILRQGSGKMPAYEAKLSDREIRSLIDWIRNQAAPANAPERALRQDP
jgi:mono/diheme cytochrome c family protein